MLFRKDDTSTIRERATIALAGLQRNSYAMDLLHNRLETRINFILNEKGGKADEYQELAKVMELVRNGKIILNELYGKIESARFLEEFITIIDSAAASVGDIKGDVERFVPIAENALKEMQDTIAKISGDIYPSEPDANQNEAQQKIIDDATEAATVQALSVGLSSLVRPLLEQKPTNTKPQEIEAELA